MAGPSLHLKAMAATETVNRDMADFFAPSKFNVVKYYY
jgi:hypothetical protein